MHMVPFYWDTICYMVNDVKGNCCLNMFVLIIFNNILNALVLLTTELSF